jgi:hypothetical protein
VVHLVEKCSQRLSVLKLVQVEQGVLDYLVKEFSWLRGPITVHDEYSAESFIEGHVDEFIEVEREEMRVNLDIFFAISILKKRKYVVAILDSQRHPSPPIRY